MNPHAFHHYDFGPTACLANPNVIASIQQQIRNAGALSPADIRLGRTMGLIGTERINTIGLNDGVFYPPDVPAPVPLERQATVRAASRAPAPASRTLHALALLVDFADNPGTRPATDFQAMLFDATNPGSMTSIYKDLSYSALTVTGEAIGYVRVPRAYSDYTAGESGMGSNFPDNTPGLLVDALTEFCKTDSLQRFDTDGDGYVDGIFLIHAGGGAEAEPDPTLRPDKIWSHKWVLPQPFMNQGVRVYAYSTEPEDGRVGVFAHEFGHVLGLPDLYDTSYRSSGAGEWCLMGGGSWGGEGDKPTRMSCWCLAQLGWIKPRNVSKSIAGKSLKLAAIAESKTHCHRLAKNAATSSPEYFLLEHRPKSGRDSELPGGGLLVWHVDERQSGNTNPLAYKVGLVQADGKRDLEFGRKGDKGDPFPGSKKVTAIDDSTTPSTRANDGSPSGIRLSSIALGQNPELATLKAKITRTSP
ncbi:MAG TPA: M6 family metalloprotease domain-containing protein [Chthoniobacterales bacterium]